jgi:hypothetical protein
MSDEPLGMGGSTCEKIKNCGEASNSLQSSSLETITIQIINVKVIEIDTL